MNKNADAILRDSRFAVLRVDWLKPNTGAAVHGAEARGTNAEKARNAFGKECRTWVAISNLDSALSAQLVAPAGGRPGACAESCKYFASRFTSAARKGAAVRRKRWLNAARSPSCRATTAH